MCDCLNVGRSHLQKLVRQVGQGAGDCEFLTDLGYLLVRGVAARCPVSGQIRTTAHDEADFSPCLAIVLRARQDHQPIFRRVHGLRPSSCPHSKSTPRWPEDCTRDDARPSWLAVFRPTVPSSMLAACWSQVTGSTFSRTQDLRPAVSHVVRPEGLAPCSPCSSGPDGAEPEQRGHPGRRVANGASLLSALESTGPSASRAGRELQGGVPVVRASSAVTAEHAAEPAAQRQNRLARPRRLWLSRRNPIHYDQPAGGDPPRGRAHTVTAHSATPRRLYVCGTALACCARPCSTAIHCCSAFLVCTFSNLRTLSCFVGPLVPACLGLAPLPSRCAITDHRPVNKADWIDRKGEKWTTGPCRRAASDHLGRSPARRTSQGLELSNYWLFELREAGTVPRLDCAQFA